MKTFGSSFTNNGLALSPDGREIYFTLIPKARRRGQFNLLLERLTITTRRQTLLADGELPAVSPDSRLLAYVTGAESRSIAVRDLATAATRSIDLTGLLGTFADVFDGSLAWLANGSGLALVTSTSSPVRVAGDSSRATRTDRGIGACAAARGGVSGDRSPWRSRTAPGDRVSPATINRLGHHDRSGRECTGVGSDRLA